MIHFQIRFLISTTWGQADAISEDGPHKEKMWLWYFSLNQNNRHIIFTAFHLAQSVTGIGRSNSHMFFIHEKEKI